MTYDDYIEQTRSQKILLAHIEAKQKHKLFTLVSGSIYKKSVNYFAVNVTVDGTDLSMASSEALLPGEFYFKPETSELFVRLTDGANPITKSVYVTYRLFFSNIPTQAPWDMASGSLVDYDSRISSIGSLKLELDFEQTGISLETDSSISFQNNDGFWEDKFDVLIFENNVVRFWSWSKSLAISQAKLIYRGLVSDKSYNDKEVSFNLKDDLSKLRRKVSMPLFSSLDGEVDPSILNKPKRLVFGKVDKLSLTGCDKVLDGYPLTGLLDGDADRNLLPGTVSGTSGQNQINGVGTNFLTSLSADDKITIISFFNEYSYTVDTVVSDTQIIINGSISVSFSGATIRTNEIENNLITGVGTAFKTELSPNDKISIEINDVVQDFTVSAINSDTEILINEELETSFEDKTAVNTPEINYRYKNRKWHIAGHKLRQYSVNITEIVDINIVRVDDLDDLEDGDNISINGQYYKIIRIVNNEIRLNQSFRTAVIVGDLLTKIPLNFAYLNKQKFTLNRDFYLTNNTNDCYIEFDDLAEFNVAPIRSINTSFTFVNGSDIVTISASDIDLTQLIKPRDWIKAKTVLIDDYNEVLSVSTNEIKLRIPIDYDFTGSLSFKSPNYIGDDSIITIDCIGLEYNNEWVRYPSQAVQYVIENAGFENINTTSFDQAEDDGRFELCAFYPENIGDDIATVRDIVTDINASVFGSLYLDQNFDLAYKVLNADKPTDMEVIKDEDIINFSVSSKSDIINSVLVNYKQETDQNTGSIVQSNFILESDFVNEAIKKVEQKTLDLKLYKESEANIIAQRFLFFKSLTQSVVTVRTKLKLSNKSINDVIYLDLDRLYRRYGNSTNKKSGIINMITRDGSNTVVQFNDLANLFSRVSTIADNSAPDFVADSEDVDKFGYIVDNQMEGPDISSEVGIGNNLIG
jgi:hypothetical protein